MSRSSMANTAGRMLITALLLLAGLNAAFADLTRDFYLDSCPQLETIVSGLVKTAVDNDPTLPPGLLRMLFHDAFVRGMDGSVLLDSTDGGATAPEKTAIPNQSLHGFDVIESIKSQMEILCPGTVSCADILALATRDAVLLTKPFLAPFWRVKLGRKDGRISKASEVNLPSPFEDTSTLLTKFQAKGFSAEEMVLLQGGGHSIGVGHCVLFSNRLTNFNNTGKPDPTLNAAFAAKLNATCNANSNASVPNDPVTPTLLDNQYFINVQGGLGLFTSDEELFFDSRTKPSIDKYASSTAQFSRDFGKAMQKLSEVEVLTGTQGSIRTKCSVAN